MSVQNALDQALRHHQRGELDAAESIYRQILAQSPRHPDALHLLGCVELARGHRDRAIPLMERAVAVAPRIPLYRENLAEAYYRTRANLIVGTTNNYAPITMSLKQAAQKLITGGRVIEDGLLNRIEMAFRLYDPCFSCATHALPGRMPLTVDIRNARGEIVRTLQRD